jgi:hypothetical protein
MRVPGGQPGGSQTLLEELQQGAADHGKQCQGNQQLEQREAAVRLHSALS